MLVRRQSPARTATDRVGLTIVRGPMTDTLVVPALATAAIGPEFREHLAEIWPFSQVTVDDQHVLLNGGTSLLK
jgi:hypothetical protein